MSVWRQVRALLRDCTLRALFGSPLPPTGPRTSSRFKQMGQEKSSSVSAAGVGAAAAASWRRRLEPAAAAEGAPRATSDGPADVGSSSRRAWERVRRWDSVIACLGELSASRVRGLACGSLHVLWLRCRMREWRVPHEQRIREARQSDPAGGAEDAGPLCCSSWLQAIRGMCRLSSDRQTESRASFEARPLATRPLCLPGGPGTLAL